MSSFTRSPTTLTTLSVVDPPTLHCRVASNGSNAHACARDLCARASRIGKGHRLCSFRRSVYARSHASHTISTTITQQHPPHSTMFGQYELFDPPPSCYDRMAQFPTVAVPCKINKQFERLVGNPLNSDMFVFIATNGERVPAHKFAVGTATPTLKRLIFGQLTTEPDDSKPLPVLSRHLLETFEGKPMLILNHLAPEQCHQVGNQIFNSIIPITSSVLLSCWTTSIPTPAN